MTSRIRGSGVMPIISRMADDDRAIFVALMLVSPAEIAFTPSYRAIGLASSGDDTKQFNHAGHRRLGMSHWPPPERRPAVEIVDSRP